MKVWELNLKTEEEWAADVKAEEAPVEPELTPAERAASAKVNPAGPFSLMSSRAAWISASRRLP